MGVKEISGTSIITDLIVMNIMSSQSSDKPLFSQNQSHRAIRQLSLDEPKSHPQPFCCSCRELHRLMIHAQEKKADDKLLFHTISITALFFKIDQANLDCMEYPSTGISGCSSKKAKHSCCFDCFGLSACRHDVNSQLCFDTYRLVSAQVLSCVGSIACKHEIRGDKVIRG